MDHEVAGRYRNEEKGIQIDIETDIENPDSPLSEADWLSFPTSTAWDYDYGTERIGPSVLAERVRQARREGGFALAVAIQAQSHVIFTAEEGDGNSEYAYGYLIVTRKGLSNIGLERPEAILQAKQILEKYNQWANGQSWRLVRYAIEQCNLGQWHQRDRESHHGYIGVEYQDTGILEDAGSGRDAHRRWCRAWAEIPVPQR